MLASDTIEAVIMSAAAKMTLAGTSLGALGIIVFVHYAQKADKAVCFPLCHELVLIVRCS